MDFLLNNSGKYRISFIPDNLTKPCEFSFKEFELVSNDRVKFDSIEIIIK